MRFDETTTTEAAARLLGDRLAVLRSRAGMTQTQAAAAAGLGRASVARVERGDLGNVDTLLRLMRLYGVMDTLDELLPADPLGPAERRERAGGAAPEPESDDDLWGSEG